MGLWLALLLAGVAGYLLWEALKDDVKIEKVSRDITSAATDEAVQAAKDRLKERIQKMKDGK